MMSAGVTNRSKCAGPQLFISENDPTILRPKKEQKAFSKVIPETEQSTTVEFSIDRQAVASEAT